MEQLFYRLSPVILFLLSIGLQIAAAVFALLLVRTTGRKLAWLLLSLAMVLMAWRRIVSFVSLLTAGKTITFEFPEYIALITSALMLMGVVRIGAYFRSIRIADEKRKRAEETLCESEARYRTLFEYAPDGILIADPESCYLDANARICGMLGYTRDELIGLHASDIVTQTEIQHIGPVLSAIKAKSDYRREWQFRRKDGSVFSVEVIVTMMPDGNMLAMIRDITERKLEEEALQRYSAELEKSNRAFQEAIADVKTLSGMLPICASCKKIRDDKGYWSQVETYVSKHTEAVFTSGICPECEKKMYEELEKLKNEDT